MDIKRLHEAIKELRSELDRVNLAIVQIERIASAGSGEHQTGGGPPKPPPVDNSGERT